MKNQDQNQKKVKIKHNSLSSALVNFQTLIGYAATEITLVLIAFIKYLSFNLVFVNICNVLFNSSLTLL